MRSSRALFSGTLQACAVSLLGTLCSSASLKAAEPAPTPAAQTAPAIAQYDLSSLRSTDLKNPQALRKAYDELFLVTSLEGLVNRSKPRLFVRYNPTLDDFWWKCVTDTWLKGAKADAIPSINALLAHFADSYKGAVVYDERVPATSNIAASVAGADNLLVLRYDESPDSLYQTLTKGPHALPVKVKFVTDTGESLFTGTGTIPGTSLPSTGSAKNDAYRWLIAKYLKPGKLNPVVLGDYIDAFWLKCWQATGSLDHATVNNLDYIIAQRGFVFDLGFFDDEVPVDDPHQKLGTDLETARLMLATCNELTHANAIITQFGFVPWAFKYTSFKNPSWDAAGHHEGVPAEWRSAEILGSYNCVLDADALSPSNFPNASFYQHQPVPARVAQKAAKPTKESLIASGVLKPDGTIPDVAFYSYYMGDYDSGAWIYANMPTFWPDTTRGTLPLSWALNPNLAARIPTGLLWVRSTATSNDTFVSGDCGAGYINPCQLTTPRHWSGLPSGVPAWQKRNEKYFSQWDLNVTGFVIEGNGKFMSDEALAAYAKFSPGGICTQYPPPGAVFQGMPMLKMASDLPPLGDGMNKAAELIKNQLNNGAKFATFRCVLWAPSDMVALEKELDRINAPPRKLVDIPTLLWLAKYNDSQPPSPTK
jgi:GxGYxYP putative glycoside hydrolase C-terminal domain/GxGYxY sequence motif in domain of unknown function N-terminal